MQFYATHTHTHTHARTHTLTHTHTHTYHALHKPRPLYSCSLDGLKDVHHSLSLQPLQLGVDGDEGTRTTNTIAAGEHIATIALIYKPVDSHLYTKTQALLLQNTDT